MAEYERVIAMLCATGIVLAGVGAGCQVLKTEEEESTKRAAVEARVSANELYCMRDRISREDRVTFCGLYGGEK